jgi:hypothetical protein
MGVLEDFGKHWFVTILCALSAAIFLGALIFSSVNYVLIVDARENIVLANAQESAEELSNGSLRLAISVEFRNPSAFDLTISTVSWLVSLDISDLGGSPFLPLATDYKGATTALQLDAHATTVFEYSAVVSDAAKISQIEEFINYSSAHGHEYTLATAPYLHDFRVTVWIDDFKHDYQYSGEFYLNDMVRLERTYSDGVYT